MILIRTALIIGILTSILYADNPMASLELIDTDYGSGALTLTEMLTYKAITLTAPESLPARYRLDRPMKDGTQIVMEIKNNWILSDPEFRRDFSFLLTRVDKQAYFDSPSGFFRIHYDTTGGHAVYQPGTDVDPHDGVPDYVNRTAEYFDLAWHIECDSLGYDTPPFDGARGGGQDLYDVYMHRFSGAYGVTFPELSSNQRPGRNNDYCSYIYVDPTYSGFGYNDRTLPMKVTSAHEFFHASQFAYNVNAGAWYMENCATWMEDILWDDINDNYAYLGYFLNNPNKAISFTNGGFEYGAFLWPMFLYESWGHDFIRISWEYTINYPALTALERTCEDNATFLEEQYTVYSLWNYLTNVRSDGNHYEEGSNYIPAWTMRTHTSYPVENLSSTRRADALGCNYIMFRNNGQEGNLQITFDGLDNQIWYVQVIKAVSNSSHVYDFIDLNFRNEGEYAVEDFGQYEWVALAADLIQGSLGDYDYSAYILQTGIGSESAELPQEPILRGNYPNPFNPETMISVYSPSEQKAQLTVYDIMGRKSVERSIDLSAGENNIPLRIDGSDDGRDSGGVYFYRISWGGYEFNGKMLYLK